MNSLIPSDQEIKTLSQIGKMAIQTGFLPSAIKTPEQAVIIALKGKELGIPPMQAFSQIAVVQGKPTISAELMLALIYRNVSSAEIAFESSTNKECIIRARRRKEHEFSKFSFTEEDAKVAGLSQKDNWKKYPAAMYRARAISAMARALFADAIAGASYTPEELGAEVNEDGEVITPPINITPPKEERPAPNAFEEVKESDANKDIDWGKYIVQFGKFKGLELCQLQREETLSYCHFILNKAHEENKKPTGIVREFLDAVSAYYSEDLSQ